MVSLKFEIYGGDCYFSYGLEDILCSELNKINVSRKLYQQKDFHVWNLSNANLAEIISFTSQQVTLPRVIFCDAKYLHIFERIDIFQGAALIDVKLSISNIRHQLAYVMKTEGLSRREPLLSSPYTSVKQKKLAMNLLQANSTEYCAKSMKMSIKTISYHKRALMMHLGVHNIQELITALKIIERFNQVMPIFSDSKSGLPAVQGEISS